MMASPLTNSKNSVHKIVYQKPPIGTEQDPTFVANTGEGQATITVTLNPKNKNSSHFSPNPDQRKIMQTVIAELLDIVTSDRSEEDRTKDAQPWLMKMAALSKGKEETLSVRITIHPANNGEVRDVSFSLDETTLAKIKTPAWKSVKYSPDQFTLKTFSNGNGNIITFGMNGSDFKAEVSITLYHEDDQAASFVLDVERQKLLSKSAADLLTMLSTTEFGEGQRSSQSASALKSIEDTIKLSNFSVSIEVATDYGLYPHAIVLLNVDPTWLEPPRLPQPKSPWSSHLIRSS